MKFPIGIQLYSVRGDMQADPEGTLRAIKAMGYDGVEFAGLYGRSPEYWRDLCAAIGLDPISAHVPVDELLGDIPGVVGAYKRIGCRYIALPWLDDARRPGHPGYDEFLRGAAAIADEAQRQGLKLLYHNHDFEFVKVDGEYALDIMYRTLPAMDTELDTCWVRVAGEDPAAYVRRYTGRAPLVHLKDFVGGRSENMYKLIGADNAANEETSAFEFRPLGSGVQDFPAILQAAEDAGASWVIVEQDEPSMGKKPLECAAMSIAYLKTL